MSNKNRKLPQEWKKGKSANPAGRQKGPAKPISSLRQTLNTLKKAEDSALDYISQVVRESGDNAKGNGKDFSVDKTRLETAQWIVKTLVDLTRAANAEEVARMDMKERLEAMRRKALEEGNEGEEESHGAEFAFDTVLEDD